MRRGQPLHQRPHCARKSAKIAGQPTGSSGDRATGAAIVASEQSQHAPRLRGHADSATRSGFNQSRVAAHRNAWLCRCVSTETFGPGADARCRQRRRRFDNRAAGYSQHESRITTRRARVLATRRAAGCCRAKACSVPRRLFCKRAPLRSSRAIGVFPTSAPRRSWKLLQISACRSSQCRGRPPADAARLCEGPRGARLGSIHSLRLARYGSLKFQRRKASRR